MVNAAPLPSFPSLCLQVAWVLPFAIYGVDAAVTCPAFETWSAFPEPSLPLEKRPRTAEQEWQLESWPNYYNGVSLGGLFVIEDWMFYKNSPPFSLPKLQIKVNTNTDQLRWNEALLQSGSLENAYATVDCHLRNFYSDDALDKFAEFGINAVRVAVGYWVFDDPSLYPGDRWIHEPSWEGQYKGFGVNPDGFITSGTRALTDLVVRLWSRNIKVVLDMHALPGCSTPHQSYAGMDCDAKAPNFWNGAAAEGVSGGHSVQRAASDPKTWGDVYRKLALERVVPWIHFIEQRMPGAILGYELLNEPDLNQNDGARWQVQAAAVSLGELVSACLGPTLSSYIFIGISYGAPSYKTPDMAQDYQGIFAEYEGQFYTDIHHYYAWAGCLDEASRTFSLQCSCESNLWGSKYFHEDEDWAGFMKVGVFDQGWRFYVGEWSAHNGPATACQNNLPTIEQVHALWKSQKWNYMSQYMQYLGKAHGGMSSMVGDFYWNGRMGYNWNADPTVCAPDTSTDHYADYSSWDWSLLRLIELGIAQPLSSLDWTPATLLDHKDNTCSGELLVQCDQARQMASSSSSSFPGLAATPAWSMLSDVLKGYSHVHLRIPSATALAATCTVALVIVFVAVGIHRYQEVERHRSSISEGNWLLGGASSSVRIVSL